MKYLTKKVLILFYLSFIIQSAQSQTNVYDLPDSSASNYRKEWANFGLGASNPSVFNGISGISAGASYHFLPGKITYQVGLNGTLNVKPNLAALNVAAGKSLSVENFLLVSAVAGPGLMWGKDKDENKFVTVGLTANLELIIKLIKGLGIGVEFYSNVNNVQNSSGVRVVLHANNDK